MGEKVFKESLLALHGSTALGAVKATVIGMNDNMIEMEFTLVRPLARSVVIATKTRYMYLASEYAARDWEAIDIKCPTFAVDIPKGKMLMIGGVDVHSRCVQESRDGELRVIVPETQYSPVESLYNEWMGT
ncbi:hypothetical protein COOONC_13083 [Cooperia oncophora]